jgi:hypothetical protein
MPKSRRRLAALSVFVLGLAAAIGCTDLSYNCVGICGTEVGNGDFEGVITANSLVDAINACEAQIGCDAGFTATCNCYLQE